MSSLMELFKARERVAVSSAHHKTATGLTLPELAERMGARNHEARRSLKKVMNREVRIGTVVRDQAGVYSLVSDGLDADVRLALRDMYR